MCARLLRVGSLLAVASVALPALAADGPSPKATAREVLKKYQDAIVAVKLVVKIGAREVPLEVAGTVLTPQGLTVVSDFTSNPGRMFGEEGGGSDTTDVQVLLKDGRELPAKFVLRDRDLDLAFVLPTEKGLDLPHVKMEKAPVPDVLDDLIYIQRLNKTLNREPSVSIGQVAAVVKKPRVVIVPEGGGQHLGCPVFDAQGRAVGLVVTRRGAGGGGRLGLFGAVQTIIVPAEDVQQVAGQVGKDKDEDK